MKRSRLFRRLAPLALSVLLAVGCAAAPPSANLQNAVPTVEPSAPTAVPSATSANPQYPAPVAQAAAGSYPAPSAPVAPPTPAVVAPSDTQAANPAGTKTFGYRVLKEYPHDQSAWTQGLIYLGPDSFYEGTGDYANSSLREIDLATGVVRRQVLLSDVAPPAAGQAALYGEGIALAGNRIFQITWQNGAGFVYDAASFKLLGRFSYPAANSSGPFEGWGLTYNGRQLIMSDGSAVLYTVDPEATVRTGVLAVVGQVEVRDANGPVRNLNELEYINGEVYANIWQTNLIARIDPASGRVLSYIDLSGLRDRLPAQSQFQPDVLNGIAYDQASRRLFVTGKRWSRLFEIELTGSGAWIVHLPVAGAA